MIKHFCDRCETQIPYTAIEEDNKMRPSLYVKGGVSDICEPCYKEFLTWWNKEKTLVPGKAV